MQTGTGAKSHIVAWVGRTPWSAADAPVGLLAPCKMLISTFRQPDEDSPPFVNVFFEFFF
jgi:hypothetical protein